MEPGVLIRAAAPAASRPGWLAPAAFAALVAAAALLGLGGFSLDLEEPRRALVALEMALRGDLVVPTVNGAPYLAKPPLWNWVLLGAVRVTGSTAEWVFRAPTVASFLLTAGLLVVALRRRLPPGLAVRAAGLFLTFTVLVFNGALLAEIDVFFALLVAAQALAVFHFEQEDRPVLLFTASYLLAALGALTKGAPALVAQGLTLVAWLAAQRRLRLLASGAHLAGLGVLALVLGGYLAAYAARAEPGPYLARLLLESVDRTAPQYGAAAVALQLLGLPLMVAGVLLPWTYLLPFLAAPPFRARLRATPALRFCAVFVAANAVPYWLSPGTRPRYLFALLPFLAVLLAAALGPSADGTAPLTPPPSGPIARAYGRVADALALAALVALPLVCAAVPFTRYGAFVASGVAWAAVVAGLGALAAWAVARPAQRRSALMLGVVGARLAYGLVVPAVRDAEGASRFARGVVEAARARAGDAPLALAGWERLAPRRPLPGAPPVAFVEREWFPLALSFYYTAGTGRVLPFIARPATGGVYLAHAGFEPGCAAEELARFASPRGPDEALKLLRCAGP